MPNLNGRVAVVTGAASGIGAATARAFTDSGAQVVVADIDDRRAGELTAELGPAACFVHTDVRHEADIARLIETAVERFGRLDCMVNNAGQVGAWRFVEDIDVCEWDAAFTLLTRSVFLGIKHAAGVMCDQRSGSIINVSSVAAVRTGFAPHPYSAAKAAVLQLSRTAAAELAEYGVRVNALVPGGVATRIVGTGSGLTGAALDRSVESVRRSLRAFQPIPRAGEAEDLAAAMAFLASDESSFITGENLGVDGGLTLGRPWPANFTEEARAASSGKRRAAVPGDRS